MAMFTLNVNNEGIGIIEINMLGESVNKLTTDTMMQLDSLLDDISDMSTIFGLIFRF